jgi:hypothetical protein
MKDIAETIKILLDQLVAFLRYFAAPLVAASVVWMTDLNHDVFTPSSQLAIAYNTWYCIIIASFGLLGVLIYSLQRAVFVPAIEKRYFEFKGGNGEPTPDERSFARWKRRAAAADSTVKKTQDVLDQANATGDFLYCSAWCIVALVVLLLLFFPGQLGMPWYRWLALIAITLGFAAAGFNQHRHTVRLDRKAYKLYDLSVKNMAE